jgi:transcription termination factor NusB
MLLARPIKNKKQRKMLFISLYQWAMTQNDPQAIAQENSRAHPELQPWLEQELQLIVTQCSTYDTQINQVSTKPCSRFAPIELTLLRLGCHELHQFPQAEHAGFLIHECLVLSKNYLDFSSKKMIHGILNALIEQNKQPPTA